MGDDMIAVILWIMLASDPVDCDDFLMLCEKVAEVKVVSVPQDRLLIFTATWCGPCQQMKPEYEALKKAGWRIGHAATDHIELIDADHNAAVMAAYRVRLLPTIIHVRDGKEVTRRVGYTPANQLSSFMGMRQ
jgi:thioredoxin 1